MTLSAAPLLCVSTRGLSSLLPWRGSTGSLMLQSGALRWEGRVEGLQSDPLSWKDFTRLFQTHGEVLSSRRDGSGNKPRGDYVSGTQGEGECG